jgi:hypothetical protein
MSKNKKTSMEPSLFGEEDLTLQSRETRDELNLALMPLAQFHGKRSSAPMYELTLKIDDVRQVRLISSKAGGGIPQGSDQDYLYAMIDMLYEQCGFKDDTIYFFITELILKADREVCQEELKRALRAIRRWRHLVVQSSAMQVVDDSGKPKYTEDDISYIQHFSIVGDSLRRGRRKDNDTSMDGKCMVVFSKYFMKNIISDVMSKPLNYHLMMKLKNPKGKKLFRLIDAFRYMEGHIGEDNYEIVSKDLMELARRIPLSDNEIKYVSTIKRSIDPIHEELKALSYINDFFYKEIDKRIHIVYIFSKFKTDQASAFNELIARGITRKAAEDLVLTHSAEKIFDCLKYCDYKSKEKEITPGYIRTTIEDSSHEWILAFLAKKQGEEKREALKDEFKRREKMKMFYDVDIENIISESLDRCSPEEKASLREKAIKKLSSPGTPQFRSESVREAAVESHMRHIISQTLGLPEFDEWLRLNIEKYKDLV